LKGCTLHQARNQLGTAWGAKNFWEWPKFFKLCPILLNNVQHIFSGGAKIFLGGASPSLRPLVTGLLYIHQKIAMVDDSYYFDGVHANTKFDPSFI